MPALYRLLLLALLLITGGCASLPDNTGRVASEALSDTADTLYGVSLQPELQQHPGKSGFLPLGNGHDALVARLVLSEYAERSIDIQYYLYHGDTVGKLVTHQLLAAADRGVRVRLLLDDMGADGKGAALALLDTHPNIEVRIFNPFTRGVPRTLQMVTRFGSVTRRMHNKSFTFDNQATIVGGRNIGNEYFNADPELAFGDLDVLAVGPVVQRVSEAFDEYWNSELAYPVNRLERAGREGFGLADERGSAYGQALRESLLARHIEQGTVQFHWGRAKALYDRPEKLLHALDAEALHLTPRLAPFVERLERELIILSAYFVPGREGVDFLVDLERRGVQVRILTNSLASTDVALVHAGYAKYRKALLRAGVELYELDKTLAKRDPDNWAGLKGSSRASLHAKAFGFDRELLFIGSLNLDPRSRLQNTEIGIIFESPELAQLLSSNFDRNVADGAFRLELYENPDGGQRIRWVIGSGDAERVHYTEPNTTLWHRFWVSLAGLLPIESQL